MYKRSFLLSDHERHLIHKTCLLLEQNVNALNDDAHPADAHRDPLAGTVVLAHTPLFYALDHVDVAAAVAAQNPNAHDGIAGTAWTGAEAHVVVALVYTHADLKLGRMLRLGDISLPDYLVSMAEQVFEEHKRLAKPLNEAGSVHRSCGGSVVKSAMQHDMNCPSEEMIQNLIAAVAQGIAVVDKIHGL